MTKFISMSSSGMPNTADLNLKEGLGRIRTQVFSQMTFSGWLENEETTLGLLIEAG